jgi:5-formyltetrahydrofolate cyclo-ligase
LPDSLIPPATSQDGAKAALRRAALDRRDALDPAYRAEASLRIAERVLPLVLERKPGVVSGYWPIRSEADPRPLLDAVRVAGIAVALPILLDATVLRFRQWHAGASLQPAGFGTLGPGPDAPEVVPDVVILPLAAFDRTGHRIGYGKGHYDRAIAWLAASARHPLLIGLAFSLQEVESVPAEPHDVALDAIVTEAHAFRIERSI